ncbi:MAG TPA: FGGY family carbohydrate kinase [Steroidobacteraceae bacterium]|jgi:glycerol kinase|nr:FGGY family carbohydrate kinase [Steroidobacteraceae bacterium]
MAERRAVLALDQGGHASRACVVDDKGLILAEAHREVRTRQGSEDAVEHDAEELAASLWQAARAALAQARAGYADLRVESAGLATQRSTIVCFRRSDGAALSAAISWQDRRNAAWLTQFAPQAARVRRITGLPLSPHYGIAKLRWCLDELEPVRRARQARELQIGPLAAYLVARLTGRPSGVDPANAARTLLWDSTAQDWSEELLELFGIPRALLPPCLRTRAEYGRLNPPGPDPSGEPREIITLRAVSGDQSAVPFAFGAPDVRSVYINLGTGAFLQRPVARRPVDPRPLLGGMLGVDERRAWYCLEGTVNGAGSAISAFCTASRCPEEVFWPALGQLSLGATLPIYINGIGGLGSPYWRPEQRSYFVGEGTLLERFAAVLESIAFLIASNFDSLARWGGRPDRVLLSGGLAASDWLCQRLASCLGVPLLRTAREATALGIAALAAERRIYMDEPALPADALQRFEPEELATSERTALAGRRARFDALLREHG